MTDAATMKSVAAFAAALASEDDFLILTHRRPDGDTIGSAIALCIGLRLLGKRAFIYDNPEAPDRLAQFQRLYVAPEMFAPKTIVTADIPSLGQMETNSLCWKNEIDYCLDHHTANSIPARKAKLVDKASAATGELVWLVLRALNVPPDQKMAEMIYISISTDTGCFKYSNTTDRTHDIAAECIRMGADVAGLNLQFFERKRRERFEIERLVYDSMKFYLSGRAASITITQKMRRETGATEDDIDDFSSIPRQVEGVLAGISAYEQPDGTTKISVRTLDQIDAADVCAAFGGGGHARAAGCFIREKPDTAISYVVDLLESMLP